MKPIAQLQLVRTLRISGAVPPVCVPSLRGLESLYPYFTFIKLNDLSFFVARHFAYLQGSDMLFCPYVAVRVIRGGVTGVATGLRSGSPRFDSPGWRNLCSDWVTVWQSTVRLPGVA